MNKSELKKNRLDIEYKFESQKAILYLTLSTITLIGFIGFMISQNLIEIAFPLGVVIIALSTGFYRVTKRKMDRILTSIEHL